MTPTLQFPPLHHSTTPSLRSAWTRRDFLKTASAATLSALAAGYPRQLLADTEEKITPTPSTFTQIDTVVDHINLTQGLENIARVMDRATLIRSYTAGDLGFILHSRHQY